MLAGVLKAAGDAAGAHAELAGLDAEPTAALLDLSTARGWDAAGGHLPRTGRPGRRGGRRDRAEARAASGQLAQQAATRCARPPFCSSGRSSPRPWRSGRAPSSLRKARTIRYSRLAQGALQAGRARPRFGFLKHRSCPSSSPPRRASARRAAQLRRQGSLGHHPCIALLGVQTPDLREGEVRHSARRATGPPRGARAGYRRRGPARTQTWLLWADPCSLSTGR
jgi:hypothetical protein